MSNIVCCIIYLYRKNRLNDYGGNVNLPTFNVYYILVKMEVWNYGKNKEKKRLVVELGHGEDDDVMHV